MVQFGMCVQQRFKPACPSTKTDQSLSFPPEGMLDPWLPIEHPSDVQASLSLPWMHMPIGAFANYIRFFL